MLKQHVRATHPVEVYARYNYKDGSRRGVRTRRVGEEPRSRGQGISRRLVGGVEAGGGTTWESKTPGQIIYCAPPCSALKGGSCEP